jgi:integrase
MGYHGLRRYYATLLIHAGASVKAVQPALGHSTPTITLNQYVHEWLDVLVRTRASVDGAPGVRETAAMSAGSRA